ncbi:MAG: hypothetical protein GY834_01140 [Bacteroidetes bacterium]|nr:hypothetical protein [Bacteroidota bacterium]
MAQTRSTSPYSIFGLGDISNSFNVKSLSMGGISYSLAENSAIHFANPASYASFDTLSFIFDAGLLANNVRLKNSSITEQTSYASISYITLGFSINKWWKTSMGLLPYSNVGYTYGYIKETEDIGDVQYYHEGSGGINQLYWGHAFKIGENISVGVNLGYYFGSADNIRAVGFINSVNYISTHISNSLSVNDFFINYGMQYKASIKDDISIVLSAVYNGKSTLKASQETLVRSFFPSVSNIENFRDTISHEILDGTVVLPGNIGFGFMLQRKDHWKIGAEFQKQYWKDFQSIGSTESLKNSLRFGLGMEFIPNFNSVNSYFSRVNYRFGIRYEQTPIELNNNSINDFGISFGIGLPLRNSRSTVNLGFEYGQRGTVKDNLIQERYFKFVIGVTMHQRWFYKRKYN